MSLPGLPNISLTASAGRIEPVWRNIRAKSGGSVEVIPQPGAAPSPEVLSATPSASG